MKGLISVINKLQDAFSCVNNESAESIQLPQIVVIGSQSAGKSSIIEAIVRRNFLPRGVGIVTRCPLILQLIHCPIDDREYRSEAIGTTSLKEFGEFLHQPGVVYGNFDEIRQEIEDRTDILAGENKGICNDPINLKIFSPNVVNLTLVDLPGITKVPLGDQPQNIEDQIKELVFQFIKNPNSIILAVSAANVDLATSEALKFAKQCDADGSRTLGVLTKLDLMDQGTDAVEVLSGRVIPVKLGIIGVVNRSQQSINDNKNSKDQLKMEATFLEKNYPELAEKNGTPYLSRTLSKLLARHIFKCLPELKERLNTKTLDTQETIKALGKTVEDENQTMIHILTLFARAYSETLEGISTNVGRTELYDIIHDKFKESTDEIESTKLKNSKELNDLSSGGGPRPSLFSTPAFDKPFERLVTERIKLLLQPSIQCVDQVHNEMKRVIQDCGKEVNDEMDRFPKLREKIFEATNQMIFDRMSVIKERVEDTINIETAYINKKHPDLDKLGALGLAKNPCGASGDRANQSLPALGQELTTEEKRVILEGLIKSYFCVVRKKVQDTIPKTIMRYLVNHVKDNIQTYLLTNVYKSHKAEELMKESKKIALRRMRAVEMMEALTRANQVIGGISDVGIEFEDDEDDC